MIRFNYRSKSNPDRGMIVVGQRDDSSLFLENASFLAEEQNRFSTIEEIEQLLNDELEMIVQRS